MTTQMPSTVTPDGPIIVFDAECILCSANAQFVLRHDHAHRFRLASMQGEVGAALYRRFGIDPADPETMIVVEGDKALRDSDAVLAIYRELGWPWKAAGVARLVPRFLRDPLYRLIARNRYRIFGKHEVCWLPSPEHADRFL
ncbi:thiol-disulfide oxidoreductase DCC family protein [Neorhizobium sp. JUb45]|uniref:thiol-disulfide oxidoreductase DCC family protein n=1 Tax=unclassified Neorhizobium TaxID=2629175 RepID=UPI0010D18846|nr:thiol-disulfide oxidoreductase DCC family protein [Neorhizobium sp. JUb45]TCR06786.1 putative DCC family thiol-disulfide oxidoreductase YuxK [Neorhizobium sp. JUb45]